MIIRHLTKTAHSDYFVTACGVYIDFIPTEHIITTYEEADKQNTPRRVGGLKEVNCKACQNTFLYKSKIKEATVKRLLGV
jgi:hypothetical protein